MDRFLRLDEACNLNMGQSPESNTYNEIQDGLPFFQGNADFGKIYPRARVWCTNPKKIVEKDTLLISVRAPIGALNFSSEKSCIGRGLAGITAKNDFNLKYIYYCLKAKTKELNAKGTGSTFKAISKNALGETQVKQISIQKQMECVYILDSINKLVEYKKQQILNLDSLIKSRFAEIFGDKQNNKCSYPIYQLSNYIEFLTSGSRGWAKYCTNYGKEWFITIKNVKNCHIAIGNMQSIDAPKNAEAARTRVQEGDLLVSITADLGRTGVVTKEIANHGAYINQHLVCVRIKQNIVNPVYLAYFMESPAGKKQFISKNQSAVKAGLNFKSINTLKVMIPPIDEQNRFADFVQQVDKLKFRY